MIGHNAIREFVAGMRDAVSSWSLTADDVVAEGDRVVVHWSATGTHAPTQRRLTFGGMDVLWVRKGMSVESRSCVGRPAIVLRVGNTAQPGRSGPEA